MRVDLRAPAAVRRHESARKAPTAYYSGANLPAVAGPCVPFPSLSTHFRPDSKQNTKSLRMDATNTDSAKARFRSGRSVSADQHLDDTLHWPALPTIGQDQPLRCMRQRGGGNSCYIFPISQKLPGPCFTRVRNSPSWRPRVRHPASVRLLARRSGASGANRSPQSAWLCQPPRPHAPNDN